MAGGGNNIMQRYDGMAECDMFVQLSIKNNNNTVKMLF